MVRNPSELLQERRKRLYWDDCYNIKVVEAVNLNWDATRGGWQFTGAVSNRYLWIICQMNHTKAMGTATEFHLHWMPTTVNVNTVKWDVIYWWKNAIGDTAQDAVGTADTITVTPSGTAHVLQQSDFSVWAEPANEEVSSILTIRLNRDGNADANNDTVLLKDFDPHIQHDSFGSTGHDVKWGS